LREFNGNCAARAIAAGVLLVALCAGLHGCALFSFESPAKPLPQRDLNARMLTREYAERFQAAVVISADQIGAASATATIDHSALQWKIGAVAASQRAATQMSPMMGLLDTWALSAQMHAFLRDGAGATVFGDQQPLARQTAGALEHEIVTLAQSLTSAEEFATYREFVAAYVRDHPLTNLGFQRASVATVWAAQTGQASTLLASVGTVPEAMTDLADRVRMYSDSVPSQTVWQAELLLQDAGYDRDEARRLLERIDQRLLAIGRLAETSPELVDEAIADLRASLFAVADRFDASSALITEALQTQLEVLARTAREERIAISETFDVQRQAIMKDAERVASDVTERSWRHLRVLTRELAVYWLLALTIVLGLPFAAGFIAGRAHWRGRAAR
jgi:hypothetical protein